MTQQEAFPARKSWVQIPGWSPSAGSLHVLVHTWLPFEFSSFLPQYVKTLSFNLLFSSSMNVCMIVSVNPGI